MTNDNASGTLLIDVSYQLRATGDVHNLVFVLNLESAP